MQRQRNLSGIDSTTGAIYSTGGRPVVVARANAFSGFLTVRRKSHGTWHERDIHISAIVELLDPEGTTYKEVD